jgi:PD-(D/E)XK nuclease superfamily
MNWQFEAFGSRSKNPAAFAWICSSKAESWLSSIEGLAPVHESIMLTYLRLSEHELGLLINFNVSVLKDGVPVYHAAREQKGVSYIEDAEATEKKVSAKHAN